MQPEERVGDIVARDAATVRVFQRHGIDFCCGGGRTLSPKGVDMFRALRTVTCLLASLVVALPASPQSNGGRELSTDLDKTTLERIEDLSESLANDLLEMSVATRDRNLDAVADHFAERVRMRRGRIEPGRAVVHRQWLLERDWGLESVSAGAPVPEHEVDRDTALAMISGILEHFGSIEDARFKVKQAGFDEGEPVRGDARVFFYLVGRDLEGRREWLRGWLRVHAVQRGPEDWEIEAMVAESVDSLVAARDLFSEVAAPAGVAARFPDFGTPPNDTVLAHGAAVADVDGDGLVDVLTTGVERNLLFRNRGDGTFEDVSEETLIAFTRPATGAVFFDADGDGDADLFLAAVGEQMLLENRLVPDGRLRFEDVSARAGVSHTAIGFSAAVADVNRDGLPDVYVSSYNRYGLVMPNGWHDATNGTPNLLFLNRGGMVFREVAREWGVDDGRWSYAAAFADVDGDGDQDLYVANDFGHNGLYRNEGNGFRDVALDAGVADPGNGMGVAFGDVDNDGRLDLHVTNMSSTAGNRILSRLMPDANPASSVLKKLAAGNTLFRGDGDGGFEDVTASLGGISAGWAYGGGFLDFDNDGWEDIYTPNGFISGKTMADT